MKGLNLAGWSKTGEDKNSTTLKHEKGHTMTIAHAKLPRIQQEALKRLKLADGGKAQHYAGDTGDPADSVVSNQPPPAQAPDTTGFAQSGQLAPVAPSMQPPASVPSTGTSQEDKQVQAYKEHLQDTENNQKMISGNANMMKQATQRFDQFNTNHPFNENQYWDDKSVPGKITSAIGLMLGGGGSGLTGGPNFASDFLNKQIDRNIEGQKTRMGQQKSIYDAYQNLFGDNNISTDLTKVNMLSRMQDKIRIGAVQLGTPQAAQTASVLNKNIDAAKDQLHTQAGARMAAIQKGQAPQPHTSFWAKLHNQLENNSGVASGFGPPTANAPQGTQPPQANQEAPNVPTPQFDIDTKGINNSMFLGRTPPEEGGPPPNSILPGDAAGVNAEVGKTTAVNDKLKLIHQNFAELWKNRSNLGPITKYVGGLGVNIGGAHLALPDMSSWSDSQRRYYRAASTIENELAYLVGNGGLTEAQAESIRNKFIKESDTPEDYKAVLKSLDNNVISANQTPLLNDRYHKIKRPKIAE